MPLIDSMKRRGVYATCGRGGSGRGGVGGKMARASAGLVAHCETIARVRRPRALNLSISIAHIIHYSQCTRASRRRAAQREHFPLRARPSGFSLTHGFDRVLAALDEDLDRLQGKGGVERSERGERREEGSALRVQCAPRRDIRAMRSLP
jgi:hypothetical protein